MDVFQELKKDHQEVRQLFGKIEALSSGARKTREDLFGKLKAELLRHAKAEEKAFYPRFRDQDQTHDLIEEAYSEHKHTEQMLERIEKMAVDSDEWMEAIKELKKEVEHHVREEENQLFPKARKLVDKNEIDSLGEAVERAKGH